MLSDWVGLPMSLLLLLPLFGPGSGLAFQRSKVFASECGELAP